MNQQRTARLTGVWYLMMAISGVLGFMVFHARIFDPTNSQTTLNNLIEYESTARIRLLFEFAIVVSQALAAAYFYKLFKSINEWKAWCVGIWGMVNSVAILISAIAIATAIHIASPSVMITDKVQLIELLSAINTNAWGIGGLFFGLWLIPMGSIITESKRMPIWLGRTLILGGVGYLLSVVVNYLDIEVVNNDLLTIPATIGEFWMIGYLLIYGIRKKVN
ncbi:MAG: DUF4386 domain-containing protein [Flavobacteriaceae bacterium]|nr:DUF4386 domain-containing protein [Flavobacteriaceae bacterium]NVJ73066.1 DUF4386 domain-containing protein [Flavobacteriaceae bacterium]